MSPKDSCPGDMEQHEEHRQFLEQEVSGRQLSGWEMFEWEVSLSVLIRVEVELPLPLSNEFLRMSFSASTAFVGWQVSMGTAAGWQKSFLGTAE